MRYIHIICIGLIVLLLGAAEAESDGNYLLNFCESKSVGSDLMWCYGYMNAILDMQAIDEAVPNRSPLCIPQAVTTDQARRVVVKYLQEHPEELHRTQAGLTYIALREAFPCPVPSAPK